MDASQTDSQDAEKVLTQSSSNSGKADEAKGMDPRGKTLPKRDLEQEAARSARAASAAKAPSTASSKSVKRSSDLQLADAKGKKLKGASAKEHALQAPSIRQGRQEIKKEMGKDGKENGLENDVPNDVPPVPPGVRSGSTSWIQLNGGLLQIELGGRRIKDAAALHVAKLVRSVLGKLTRHPCFKPRVSLNLAGNRLGKAGLMTLLQSLEVMESLEIAVLNLEWNRMDPSAVTALASWLSKRDSPPQKLLLSHNSAIGDMAAQHLFQTLGGMRRKSSVMPWIESKYIGIKDLDAFMEVLSLHVNFCFALDTDVCAPDHCASEETSNDKPHLHLVGILEQRLETERMSDSLEDSVRASDSGSSPRLARLGSDSQANESQETVKSVGTKSQESPKKAQSENLGGKQDKQDRKVKQFPRDPDSEEKERRNWAASLGKSGVPDARDIDMPAPAPATSLWDLACAEAKKARKSGQRQGQASHEKKGSSESMKHSPKTALDEKDRVSKVTLRTLGSFSEQDTDYVALKAVVDGRVRRKNELWKALTITESEKWLRQKCLVNELCKQIFEEGFRTATGSAGSWEAYLKTFIGHQHVLQWLDKKLSDATKACKPR